MSGNRLVKINNAEEFNAIYDKAIFTDNYHVEVINQAYGERLKSVIDIFKSLELSPFLESLPDVKKQPDLEDNFLIKILDKLVQNAFSLMLNQRISDDENAIWYLKPNERDRLNYYPKIVKKLYPVNGDMVFCGVCTNQMSDTVPSIPEEYRCIMHCDEMPFKTCMGVMLNSALIPIDYEISFDMNEININEKHPLWDMEKRHRGSHIVEVRSDFRGLRKNMSNAVMDRNGFIYAKSIKASDDKFKDWVADLSEYVYSPKLLIAYKSKKESVYVKQKNSA
ncbi:MAG: hypothetical protein LUB61_00650, partial [Eggerthellaceae bacterium]|nr:hypothetical protein [Eggerthellaceae bacterium]